MRQTGTVKFYNDQKGYGFITPDGGGKDVFVHVTALEESGINNLSEGSRISLEAWPSVAARGSLRPLPQNVETPEDERFGDR